MAPPLMMMPPPPCTQVWQARPLLEELLHYAAADVRYLHLLADSLNKLLPPTIVQKVE